MRGAPAPREHPRVARLLRRKPDRSHPGLQPPAHHRAALQGRHEQARRRDGLQPLARPRARRDRSGPPSDERCVAGGRARARSRGRASRASRGSSRTSRSAASWWSSLRMRWINSIGSSTRRVSGIRPRARSISMLTPARPFRDFFPLPESLKWLRLALTPTADGGVDLAIDAGDASRDGGARRTPSSSRGRSRRAGGWTCSAWPRRHHRTR